MRKLAFATQTRHIDKSNRKGDSIFREAGRERKEIAPVQFLEGLVRARVDYDRDRLRARLRFFVRLLRLASTELADVGKDLSQRRLIFARRALTFMFEDQHDFNDVSRVAHRNRIDHVGDAFLKRFAVEIARFDREFIQKQEFDLVGKELLNKCDRQFLA